MSKHRRGRRTSPPPCHVLHEDDGVDPRLLRRAGRLADGTHATDRLCGQVARLLTLALAGLSADEALPSCHVVTVGPAPDASRLRVVVAPFEVAAVPAAVLAWLEAVRPRLRAELAAGLHRRRVPDLVFAVAREGGPA
jgi:ribosome-binding factor A